MPLQHSRSDAAFKSNVSNLMHEVGQSPHVQSRDQALAIAYSIKRRGKGEGGPVVNIQGARNDMMPQEYRGEVSVPVTDQISGFASGSTMPSPNMPLRRAPFDARIGMRYNFQDGGSVDDASRQAGLGMLKKEMRGPRANINSAMQGLAAEDISDNVPRIRRSTPYGLKGMYIKTGGAVGRQFGGRVHTGPIMSAVPGRTDHHAMSVKAGSYVLPADHVSSMGQGNSIAGLAKLNKMFKMGPYGAPAMPMKPGRAHFPKLPHIRKTAAGGVADGTGEPVDINAAGGEFVIPPEKIMEWMSDNGFKPDLKHGHAELDRWVVEHRKEHRKTLASLPGPAKS